MKVLVPTSFLLLLACQSRALHPQDSGTKDNQSCGDLQADNDNCGRCGNVCSVVAPSTAQCVMGRCLTTLVSQDRVPRVVVVSTGVYWLNTMPAADGGSTTALWRTGLEGGAPVTMLTGRCDLGANNNGLLAVDATSLYCAVGRGDGGRVVKMPLDGASAPGFFAGGDWFEIYDLAIDTSNLYWSTCYKDSYIKRVRLDGAGGTTEVASSVVCPLNLVLRDSSLDWVGDWGPTDKWGGRSHAPLMKISATDDGAKPLPLLEWGEKWGRFAVGDAAIYWTNPDQGSVMALPRDGGSPSAVLTGLDSPRDVAVDANHIYWVSTYGGQVMKLSLSDGALTTLATGQNQPHGIVIDTSSVYWISTEGARDTVMKLTPK
jgi:hypothetical protein